MANVPTLSERLKLIEDNINNLQVQMLPIGTIIQVQVGTIMNSTYWKKLTIKNGYTLVAGITKGAITNGSVQGHTHAQGGTALLPIGIEKLVKDNSGVGTRSSEDNLAAGLQVEYYEKIK